MSDNRYLFISALLSAVSLSWSANALTVSDKLISNFIYTHTYTSTPSTKPAASFAQLDKAYKIAGVCFLGFGGCGEGNFSKDDDYTIDTEKQCLNEEYIKLNCNSVQEIDEPCPYNAAYGKKCKCASNLITCPNGQVGVGDSCEGKYISCKCDTSLISCPSNKIGSGASCGGKYQSCICKSEYLYTLSNCTSPRSLSGLSCDGKYTGCSCPVGVSTNSFGCEEYYPSPCSSVCKIAKTDNCDNRTAVSTPYGCAEYWSDCPSKCKTAYNDNCRNRTAVTCQFGCASYFGDCKSKCQTCSSDNCANRTAVIASCPSNATCLNFSDCTSKIQSWSCNSGYINVDEYWCDGDLKCIFGGRQE